MLHCILLCVHGKKLLLLDRIAKSLEWPDKHLHRDLCAGFKLSGVPDPTGVFEADHKPALASEEQFWDAAEVLRGQLWSRVRDQPPQEYDDALSEITTGETSVPGGKGWLDGPFSYADLERRGAKFLTSYTRATLFGVGQKPDFAILHFEHVFHVAWHSHDLLLTLAAVVNARCPALWPKGGWEGEPSHEERNFLYWGFSCSSALF